MEFKSPKSIHEKYKLEEIEGMLDLAERGLEILENDSFSRVLIPGIKSLFSEEQIDFYKKILHAESCIGMYLGYLRREQKSGRENLKKVDERRSRLLKRILLLQGRENIEYNPLCDEEVYNMKLEWNEYLKRH